MERKIQKLETLLEKAEELKNEFLKENFDSWKTETLYTLEKIYKSESNEVKKFESIQFSPLALSYMKDNTEVIQNSNLKGLSFAITLLKLYINDLKEKLEENQKPENLTNDLEYKKIFISHSSKDKKVVENIIELLEDIGIESDKIFCTSIPEYGVEFGENFLERIKAELNSDVLVLFVLSDNFYNSKVCLCEMGATWVKTNKHIPILIPPFDYSKIEGVIPSTHGLKINDSYSLTSFKENLEKDFKLKPIKANTWDRKKNKFIKNCEQN